MARYSKPSRPMKRDTSPNIILVIMAVMFFLSNLVVGVWGYFGYEGQEALRKAAEKESEKAKSNLNAKEYNSFLAQEMCSILGEDIAILEAENYLDLRGHFLKDDGKYKDQPTREAFLKLIQKTQKEFNWDEKNKYAAPARAEIENLRKEVARLKGIVIEKDKKLAEAAEQEQKSVERSADFDRRLLKDIKDGAKASLEAAMQKTAEMIEAFNRNGQLQNDMTELKERHKEEAQEWARRLTGLGDDLTREREKSEKLAGNQPAAAPDPKDKKGLSIPHYLMLDVSTGKTLWDHPVGKVVRVIGEDKVEILLFSNEHSLRPKLTFNVFARLLKDASKPPPASANDKAEGDLKGTLEVLSVEANKSAICRVTARFDPKNPPAVDDLLYNMFFGAHVAVAGQANMFGKSRGESATELDRNLKRFLANLEDQGITVDAYVDLVTGDVKGKYGAIRKNVTRFLILGDELNTKRGLAGQQEDEAAGIKRDVKAIENVNTAIQKMHADAGRNHGLFIISPENFANVVGLRKIGGYGRDEYPFQPQLPKGSP